MKTSFTYGFSMALAGALLGMALFFLGFHSDVDKLDAAQKIEVVAGLGISVLFIGLGIREQRDLTPSDKKWGYGSALWTGIKIGFVGSFLAAFFNYAYFAFIDPSYSDIILQGQLDKMEAQGISADKMDQIEPMMKKWINPVVMTISGFFGGILGTTIVSLILAAFFRKRPEASTPTPPAL